MFLVLNFGSQKLVVQLIIDFKNHPKFKLQILFLKYFTSHKI